MGLFDRLNTPRWYEPGSYVLEAMRSAPPGAFGGGIGEGLGKMVAARSDSGVKDTETGKSLSNRELGARKAQREFDAPARWQKFQGELKGAPDWAARLEIFGKYGDMAGDPVLGSAFSAAMGREKHKWELEQKTNEGKLILSEQEDQLDLHKKWGLPLKPNPEQVKEARARRNMHKARTMAGGAWNKIVTPYEPQEVDVDTEGFLTFGGGSRVAPPAFNLPVLPNGNLDEAEWGAIIRENTDMPPGTYKGVTIGPDGIPKTTYKADPPTSEQAYLEKRIAELRKDNSALSAADAGAQAREEYREIYGGKSGRPGTTPGATDTVHVRDPNGKVRAIPRAMLPQAIAGGGTVVK